MHYLRRICIPILITAILTCSGCVNNAKAPIANKSATNNDKPSVYRRGENVSGSTAKLPTNYTVRRGDTLHSIAWRFGLDVRALTRWNRIANPNLIFVGQKLRLSAPAQQPSRTASRPARQQTAPAPTPRKKPQLAKKESAPIRVSWVWPATGEVKRANSALGTKAIQIFGKRGAPIKAAAGGKVVYSGSGLRGYGRLIIVKHSEEYLSAYAHNERLLVAEGASVKPGQAIAEMGDSEAKRVMLHFEIRRNGKGVDALGLLPRL